MITAEDLYLRVPSEPKSSKFRRTEEESKELINIFLDGFDTAENEVDRRIYYETTGIELIEGEFSDLETSDEEWKIRNQVDPQELAFSYNQIFDHEYKDEDARAAGGTNQPNRKEDGKSTTSTIN